MDFDNVFTGTQMRDEYYPDGCDSQSPSKSPSETPSASPAKFADNAELKAAVEIYIQGQDAWEGPNCDGTSCDIKYGYAKLLT
jgi:hypothetical protein